MLTLLRTYLQPYRRWILAVLVFQAVQATASLLLPSLNADIIDKGVFRGDTGKIWSIGATMLAVSAVQGVFSVAAVYCGAKAAMGFGRDVRGALFHLVGIADQEPSQSLGVNRALRCGQSVTCAHDRRHRAVSCRRLFRRIDRSRLRRGARGDRGCGARCGPSGPSPRCSERARASASS